MVVSLIGLALGVLVVVQLGAQAAVARTLASQDNTSVALLINDLNRANNQLIQQAAALSLQETQLRQALTAGGADAQTISKELQTLRAVTGAVPVHGPGLQIRIMGPIMDFELQDLQQPPRRGWRSLLPQWQSDDRQHADCEPRKHADDRRACRQRTPGAAGDRRPGATRAGGGPVCQQPPDPGAGRDPA